MSKGVHSADAADLVQEAFLKLWNNCAKVEESKSKSFLFTIVNNLFIDNYRKGKTQLKIKENYKPSHTPETPQYKMEMEEFKEKLENCISTMPTLSKEVFIMHRFDSMKYREIAEYLNISIKAVEKRMHKALLHLSEKNILLKR